MTKGMFISAAITVALCTAAVTTNAHAEQMDAQTAELLRFIEGDSQAASYDAKPVSASMLEFEGGELQAPEYAGKDLGICRSCCPPTWVGGAEITMFRPHVHGKRYQQSIGVVDDVELSSHDHPMDNVMFAPRVWLGKQGECWGVITRFWYMNGSNMSYDYFEVPAVPDDPIIQTAGNRVKAYTIDLELNRRLHYGCWLMNLGVGARYASLEVDTMATHDRFDLNTQWMSSAFTKSQIDAFGLTVGLDGRRVISDCHNLSVFWALRGSILWGDTSLNGSARAVAVDNGIAYDYDYAAAYDSSNESLFIGEVQLGLIWEHRLACLPANVFVKVAAEYQYWDSSESNAPMWDGAFADPPGASPYASGQFDSSSPSVSLFGLNLGIGLTWGGCCDSYR